MEYKNPRVQGFFPKSKGVTKVQQIAKNLKIKKLKQKESKTDLKIERRRKNPKQGRDDELHILVVGRKMHANNYGGIHRNRNCIVILKPFLGYFLNPF